jgi:AcrR family transcriptional regulator
MSSTKERIVETAIGLFNRRGFVNVTMRDLAQELGISLGNVTYHFNRKDDLIAAIHQQLIDERNAMLETVQLTPSIANINAQLLPLLELYERYRFFYLDIMEVMRAYPDIAERHREHIANQIRYIRAIIDYSVGSGNMLSESKRGQYDSLAETVCLMLTFWLSHHTVRGKEGSFFNNAREAMWALVIPLLTEKGKQAFEGVLKGVKV